MGKNRELKIELINELSFLMGLEVIEEQLKKVD